MCFKIQCKKCLKYTYGGCGNHIEVALKDVPLKERCKCKRN